MPGLSLTLADTLMKSLASTHASAHRGPVGSRGTPPNSRGASGPDAIAASKTRAILRSTTPSYFGESTGVYSRRIRWLSSSITNSPLVIPYRYLSAGTPQWMGCPVPGCQPENQRKRRARRTCP